MRDWLLGIRSPAGLACAVLLLAAPLSAQTSAAGTADDRWHFNLGLPLWGAGIDGTVSFKGIPEQDVHASFGEILDHFDFGLAGQLEGRKGHWGFVSDLLYMNLTAKVPTGEVLGRLHPEVDLRQVLVEGAGFYRLHRGDQKEGAATFVDVLAGVLYNGMSSQLKGSEFSGTKRTFGWVDAFGGARFQAPLGRKLSVDGRGDIGGLGSDLAWQLQGNLWFAPSPRWSLGGGYRYYDVHYDKGSGTGRKLYDVASKGPVLTVVYGW